MRWPCQSGASDPTTQSWTYFGGGNAWAWKGDSGNGGWRIVDGTSSAGSYYQHNLTAGEQTLMGGDWTATWTLASNGDAINASTFIDNYYSGTPANQNNNAMWIELDDDANGIFYRYILSVKDNSGTMVISDGTTDFDVTGAGFSQESNPYGSGGGTTAMDFVTFTLAYNSTTGQASLSDSEGNNHGVVATSGAATQDRIVWGATSSGGQGSTTWNSMSIVPEPSSLLLIATGLLTVLGLYSRRRRTA